MEKLTSDNAVLVLVDVQERLAVAMHERDALLDSLARLLDGLRALDVPVVWMEQTPDKIGPTVAVLRDRLQGERPSTKACFSCCGADGFLEKLASLARRRVLLAGIETHVCVYQTATDLVREGYGVDIVADAVSSRTAANREIGLGRCKACGAGLTSVETLLFEMLGDAGHPQFRTVLGIVK